jgi:PIN domain nuclease of toxin-antitoxin system
VNLLLDTHALLWWLNDEPSLSEQARTAIADPANTVYLSAVVVWEIRIKQSIGKLELPESFREVLAGQPFVALPVTVEHAHALADLPALHRDPFDRMLVAQARVEGMTVVTRDPTIPRYGIRTVAA